MYHRVIIAICKHIAVKKTGASARICISIQEPLNDGVIVTGLEVIPSSVSRVVVSSKSALPE